MPIGRGGWQYQVILENAKSEQEAIATSIDTRGEPALLVIENGRNAAGRVDAFKGEVSFEEQYHKGQESGAGLAGPPNWKPCDLLRVDDAQPRVNKVTKPCTLAIPFGMDDIRFRVRLKQGSVTIRALHLKAPQD